MSPRASEPGDNAQNRAGAPEGGRDRAGIAPQSAPARAAKAAETGVASGGGTASGGKSAQAASPSAGAKAAGSARSTESKPKALPTSASPPARSAASMVRKRAIPRPLRTPARTLLIVGVTAALTGGAMLGLTLLRVPAWGASLAAMLIACPLAMALAMVLIVNPEARLRSRVKTYIGKLEAVAKAQREEEFATLLVPDDDHELAELGRAVHDAIAASHRDRLEAARLRRDLEARVERRTRAATAQLSRLSETDELTGLLNRRGFETALEAAVIDARRDRTRLALVAIDLDYFKQLNDTMGHDKGDEALAIVGELMRAQLRPGDAGCRLGGDEFALLLPGADYNAARAVVKRLMDLFSRHPAARTVSCPWPAMSAGLACLGDFGAAEAAELRRLADEALYASKRSGRDRSTTIVEARHAFPPTEARGGQGERAA